MALSLQCDCRPCSKCDYSCRFGFSASPRTCTLTSGPLNTLPAVTDGPGYAVIRHLADFGPLCNFAYSRGYCLSGGWAGLCSFPC